MLYTVFYRIPGARIWEKIRDVDGDFILPSEFAVNGQPVREFPVRVVIQKDKTRWELPMTWGIKFSKERFVSILSRMETESGHKMKLKEE